MMVNETTRGIDLSFRLTSPRTWSLITFNGVKMIQNAVKSIPRNPKLPKWSMFDPLLDHID